MEKAILAGGDIEGNIGSCQVLSETFDIKPFKVQTIATNSCTGEIVANTTYTNLGNVMGLLLGIVMLLLVVLIIWVNVTD